MRKKELGHKETGFKVPEGYFQDFEARMMEKVSALENEEQLNSNPFKVPEGYFAEFENRLMEKIEEDRQEPKVIPLHHRKMWSYVASVAAVLAVILSSVVLTDSQKATFDNLDIVAVENYLLETLNMDETDETLFVNDEVFGFASSPDSNIDHEAVLEYLNENVEETSLLLNEE